MILVTLGTQDKSFKRLLDSVNKAINEGFINDKIIVQAGYTEYHSDKMEIFDFISIEEMDKFISSADIIITHAGVGSIIKALKMNKKVIVAPRLKEYGEHTNNHQLDILNNFKENGYIIPLEDFDKLGIILQKIDNYKLKEYVNDNNKIINIIKDFIGN